MEYWIQISLFIAVHITELI